MDFEAYAPAHHLMQRLADDYMRKTPDGVFYRSRKGGLVYVPREIPPLRPSDQRRTGMPKG
jgi:hypothetical protein